MVSISVNCTSCDRGADGLRAVADMTSTWIDGGIAACSARQCRLDAVHRVDDVGARLLEHDQHDAAHACSPRRRSGVFSGAVDRVADILDTDRRAVAIGDDDVRRIPGRLE